MNEVEAFEGLAEGLRELGVRYPLTGIRRTKGRVIYEIGNGLELDVFPTKFDGKDLCSVAVRGWGGELLPFFDGDTAITAYSGSDVADALISVCNVPKPWYAGLLKFLARLRNVILRR